MANKPCVSCGREIAGHATHCAYCRAEQPTPEAAAEPTIPATRPGWYVRDDEVNSMGYFDGKTFTGPTMPARITLELGTLVRGVALGAVAGTLITGFLFFLLTR